MSPIYIKKFLESNAYFKNTQGSCIDNGAMIFYCLHIFLYFLLQH